jgi:MFS family permease
MASPSSAAVESTSLIAHRSFVLFLLARIAAMLAHQMLAVGVGWQIYAMTGRALDLGLVGLAQFIPSFLLVLVAGHVADRFDRRRVLQACMLVEALAAGGLALGSYQGWIDEFGVFALVFAVGAARAFQMPAMAALLPLVVPRPLFPRAIASNSAANQAAVIVGPALGGFVYVAGASAVYAFAMAMFVTTGVVTAAIRVLHAQGRTDSVGLDSVFAGIRYIRAHPAILGAISLDLFAVLLGGATALLPVYARDILDTGPWGLGLLRSSTAVGALATALYLARRPMKRNAGPRMFAAVALFGVATIVFGVSRSFALSLVALAVMGAADMVSVVVRSSLVQLETPDAMRGRVSAVNALFIGTSNQLGEFESGVTAAWFGVVPSVVIGGLGTLGVVALWIYWFRELWRVDRLETRASAPATPKTE